ncbi:MAG: hypothetical protein IM571_11965 [Chitinophagaceae bacterium]|nr:hypothetical protein [Chitinophagaceae bacterium]
MPNILLKYYLKATFVFHQKSISLMEGTDLAKLCDYSFGDQAAVLCKIPGGKMKLANLDNVEFKDVVAKISRYRNYMTVFIDNVRLYNRKISVDDSNQKWIGKLMAENDLLNLCSYYSTMNFIIFTNLEDTPIDSEIEGKIPSNVLKIYSANAIYNSEKVIPFPYGIQRRMWLGDIRKELLLSKMKCNYSPIKLLYVNHSVHTNVTARSGIKELFSNLSWATVVEKKVNYRVFLSDIKNHKFVICPIGNAIDCHRNWEVLYMRRVPVMIKNEYLQKLFKGLPVLFVDDFSVISEDFLEKNNHLYHQAQSFNLQQLDLEKIFFQILDTGKNEMIR